MSTIPTSLTEKQFDEHICPYISTAKRGFESKIPLFKILNYVLYRLHTGCQWYQLPIVAELDKPYKKEISYDAAYYHFRKWSRDGSHVIAKKGGEALAYQGRKKAKTTNILPMTDAVDFIITSTGLLAGKHRFTSERSFAWIDKFRALILRFDRCKIYFLGAHYIAFAMINLRHLLQD